MDSKIIEQLIEKYFEGETSLEEELTLKSYFGSGEVADSLKMYRPLFQYFQSEQATRLSADFEEKLKSRIESSGQETVIRRLTFTKIWKIAAAVVLLTGTVFLVYHLNPNLQPQTETAINWEDFEPKDPQEAYEKTLAALALVSDKMNKGKYQTQKGLLKMDQANQAVSGIQNN